MSVICGWNIANSFLKKSFEECIYITPFKLNCLVYLLYSNYLYKSGEKLFNESFIKTNKGPVLPTIEFKFGCFKNHVITKYAKNATSDIILANGNLFGEILSSIWNRYKNMNDIEILTFLSDTSSITKKENNEYICDSQILDDEIKRNQTAIEKAKYNRKKILSNYR